MKDMEFVGEFLNKVDVFYQRCVDLKRKTWIHRGGTANYYIIPSSVEELHIICSFFYSQHIFFEIVGYTSNLYFHNTYSPNIVISTIKVKEIEETEEYIICACGVNVASLSRTMVKQGIKGFEGLIDLPGTIGASVYNNSSCYNYSIAQILIKIEFLQEDNTIIFLSPEDLNYTKRSSSLKRKERTGVILRVYLKKEYDSSERLMFIADKNQKIRKITQEGSAHNLGSCYVHLYTDGIILFCLRIIYFSYKLTAMLLRVDKLKQMQAKKIIYFSLLGYKSILPYVSCKSVNCFIWIDDEADDAFLKYQTYMKKVFKANILEIEIKK